MVAAAGVPVVLMHHQGDPQTMQDAPRYGDVLVEVYRMARGARSRRPRRRGSRATKILVDPGIGFGKTVAHNLELLNGLALFHGLGCAIVVGASRKRMIGALAGEAPADQRLAGSLALALKAVEQGAQLIRVHDVPETVQALKVWRGLRDAALTPRRLKATISGPSSVKSSIRPLAGSHKRTDRPVEVERVAGLEPVAEEARQLAERDDVGGDDEQGRAVGADADRVADVARGAVGIELGVELAVDHQHRARLGGEGDVGGGLEGGAGDDLGAAVLADHEHAVGHAGGNCRRPRAG